MKKHLFLTLFWVIFGFFAASCEKKNPTPELEDSIYTDLKQELDISIKQEADLIKQLDKDTLNYKSAKPQSGEAPPLRNKMSSSENLLDIIRQQKKFFEIKIEQRKIYVRQRYLESFKEGGRAWPDPKEIEDYKVRMRLQRAKFEKDAQSVPRGTSDTQHKGKAPESAKTAPAKH